MGPWTVVGAGAVGATVIYAEGAPDWPHDRLWATVESERVTMLGVSPTLDPRADPEGRADARPLVAARRSARPASRGTATRTSGSSSTVGGGRVPIVNISGGTEVGACFLSTCIVEPIKPVALGFPALGEDMDVVDARGTLGARRGRRARLPATVAGDDARRVARPRALPRDVLAALPRRVDARRLGLGRRGRLLVPARPQRRHAEHRGQADRPGRARVGGDRVRARRRGGGGRHPARGEGRDGVDLLRREARRGARRASSSRTRSPASSARRSSPSGSSG